jgi:hypothetical protein
MFPLQNTFAPAKKTRDFGIADTTLSFSDSRPEVVAAGHILAPDTLVVLTALSPDTVAAALTGMPVIGTDTVFGVTTTYSNNSASVAGLVGVAHALPGMTYRVKVDATAAAVLLAGGQTSMDAIIGIRYFLTTTTDADGFDHQVLNVTGGTQPTSMIRVVDGDFSTGVVLVQLVA